MEDVIGRPSPHIHSAFFVATPTIATPTPTTTSKATSVKKVTTIAAAASNGEGCTLQKVNF